MSKQIKYLPRFKKSYKQVIRSGVLKPTLLDDCIDKIANNIPLDPKDVKLNTANLKRIIYFTLLIDYV